MMRKELFKFSKSDLLEGINFIENKKYIAFCKDGLLKSIIKNECQHMNGKFSRSSDCILTCKTHGWKLDIENMEYSNPQGVMHLNNITFKESESGEIEVFENVESIPSDFKKSNLDKKDLNKGELGIAYYSHACVKIKAGVINLFTDPWVKGPAFSKGWWPIHKPVDGWEREMADCSLIYISHNHSDHMNEHTLKEVCSLNSNVPIIIPNFKNSGMKVQLEEMGFKNVNVRNFYEWIQLNKDFRYMVLPDASGRHDSGLLCEYKGSRILTTVDCSNCCGGNLPEDIDLLLSSFAGGATGFPVCWENLYSLDYIRSTLNKNKATLMDHVIGLAQKTSTKSYIPYAGYFTEAHPLDQSIKELNNKNKPEDVMSKLEKRCPEVKVHIPYPGDFFDLSSLSDNNKRTDSFHDATSWDFQKYDELLTANPFSLERLTNYFDDLEFEGNLILHILECDDYFNEVYREYMIDFSKKVSRVSFKYMKKPGFRYLKIKTRQKIFSYVLEHKLPWEELSIGFQARFYREPDQYNYDFWHYMQNNL